MNAVGLLFVLVTVLISGCTQQPAKPAAECAEAYCPTRGASGLPPGPGGGPPLPNATLPLFQFENCTAMGFVFDGVAPIAGPLIPPAFKPAGINDWHVPLVASAETCGRTLDNRTVFGPASRFWTYAFVDPVNESWRRSGYIDYYVFDFVTNTSALAASLNQVGLGVGNATISSNTVPLQGGFGLEEWNVDARDWTAKFHHQRKSFFPGPDAAKIQMWFGTGPFHRLIVNLSATVQDVQDGGELLLDGNSKLQQALGVPATASGARTYVDVKWLMVADLEEYR